MRAAWIVVLAAAACGPRALPVLKSVSPPDKVRAVQQLIQPEPALRNALGKPLAFVVTPAEGMSRAIVAVDLAAGKVLWRQTGIVSSRVTVGRDLVAHAAGDRVVARDVRTGAVRFEAPFEGQLLGVTADQSGVYVASLDAERGTRLVGLGAGGERRFVMDVTGLAGAPVARGGLVFLPVLGQFLVVLEGHSGQELVRVLSKEEQISFVRAVPEGITFGMDGVFMLPDGTAEVTRDRRHYTRARLPNEAFRTAYGVDTYSAVQADYSAFDRNRLLWRLGARQAGELRLDAHAAVHSFRFVFGFDALSGEPRWAYANPRADLVASAHLGGQLGFVSQDGELMLIDAATGARRVVHRMSGPVLGATFDADGLAPAGDAEPARPLVEALGEIVRDRDPRFLAAKTFAVDALARAGGRAVTPELVRIVTGDAPAEVQRRAAEALGARKDKAAMRPLVEAVSARYDWGTQQKPLPVHAIARALGAIGEGEAAAALAARLGDPSLDGAAVAEIAGALGKLGAKRVLPVLRAFLCDHRADPTVDADVQPLGAIAEALLALGAGEERDLLRFVAEDRRTRAPLAERIRAALAGPKP